MASKKISREVQARGTKAYVRQHHREVGTVHRCPRAQRAFPPFSRHSGVERRLRKHLERKESLAAGASRAEGAAGGKGRWGRLLAKILDNVQVLVVPQAATLYRCFQTFYDFADVRRGADLDSITKFACAAFRQATGHGVVVLLPRQGATTGGRG